MNDYGGKTLLIGASLVIVDLIVLLIDLIVEKDSRRNLGGLPHIEYIIHVIANALHFLAIGLILVAKPLAYWSLTAPTIIDRDYPDLTRLVAENLFPGTALLVIVHFVLMNKKVATIFENLMDKIAKKIN